jgi:hypothetical protein
MVHPWKEAGSLIATFFNGQINWLADRSLMEIEQNVNLKRKAPGERGVGWHFGVVLPG